MKLKRFELYPGEKEGSIVRDLDHDDDIDGKKDKRRMESVDVYRSAGRQPLSHEWPPFLKSYRRGRWDEEWGKTDVETNDNDADVEHLGERHCSLDFFRKHGFLAAPRPSKEAEKLIRATL